MIAPEQTKGQLHGCPVMRGCNALQVMYMHARGYCHRDLKPENCVIETATMTLKVRSQQRLPQTIHSNATLVHCAERCMGMRF